ncbi:caspase domain-containing protein [Streptomyces sp. NPDC088116]|uniref:caspase family protein n=1 Tax=Streptomyces sp. NPDC088116 TaxID=3365825 RepID=UPI00381FDCFD
MGEPEYRALLIGNATFPQEPEHLPDLKGPRTDVDELHRVLVDREVGLYELGSVETALDETNQELKTRLVRFFGRARPDEQLLLYYSGHGRLDTASRLHLCARDTTLELLRTHSLQHQLINELIDDCPARAIVVLLDCCFSGVAAVKGLDVAQQLAGQGRYVLASSSHADYSRDAATDGELSPFTHALVQGLESGVAGHDGYVMFQDLYSYMQQSLATAGPVPHMKAAGGAGQLPMARRRDSAPGRRARPLVGPGSDVNPTAADLSPEFLDSRGNGSSLPVCSDARGVLYARLPDNRTAFGVTRDDLVAAGRGEIVDAYLYDEADATSIGKNVDITYSERRAVRSISEDGSVYFGLPSRQVITWNRRQVATFTHAKEMDYWPRIRPWRRRGEDRWTDAQDPAFDSLAAAPKRLVALVGACIGVLTLTLVLYDLTRDGRMADQDVPAAVQTLAFVHLTAAFLGVIGCVAGCLGTSRKLWALAKIRQVRGDPAANVTAMVMVHKVKRVRLYSMAGGVEDSWEAWAFLWPKEQRHVKGVSPQLSVPLLDSYLRTHQYVLQNVLSRDGSTVAEGEDWQIVEVIGDPRPGEWVLLRTAQGTIWPKGSAVDSMPWETMRSTSPGPT